MNKLKLIIACAVIIGLAQLKMNGAGQRKYYTGSKAIQARQEAAAAGQLPAAPAGSSNQPSRSGFFCSGDGFCTMKQNAPAAAPTPTQTPEQEQSARNQALLEQKVEQQAQELEALKRALDELLTKKN